MIRIIEEPQPAPKPDPKPIINPSENNINKYLKILVAIVAIIIVGYAIKSFMGSKAEDELTLENEKAMSLAKLPLYAFCGFDKSTNSRCLTLFRLKRRSFGSHLIQGCE